MISGLLLSGAVRAAVVLAVGLMTHALLSRAAAATRRFVLVLTLGAAIVVPVAAAAGPRWNLRPPAGLSVFAHESASEGATSAGTAVLTAFGPMANRRATESSSAPTLDALDGMVLAWFIVAAALLTRTVASQLRAHALVRRTAPVEGVPWMEAAKLCTTGRLVDVRASSAIDSPAVTGILHPTIVVPQSALDWPLERCLIVLAHELAHVRRRDVLVQALADVACAIHWCNPLVWICARRLRLEREIAADDAVLAAGIRPSRYAEELLAVATSMATPRAALAMAERSSLETRVESILALSLARAPLPVRGTITIVVAGAVLAAAASCTSAQMSAPQGMIAQAVVPPRVGTANDAEIQRAADEGIAAIATQWSPELATIIVLDPATGEILANAGQSAGKTADVASLVAMDPGSTLKPITIAAALEMHAITVDQKFECGPNPRMYGDKALEDHHPDHANETLDVAHLLAVSSNIGTSHIFDALGGDNLAVWFHRFHFGEPPGIPGAATGTFPARVVTGSFEGAMLAIGEGLKATPLQMISAYGVFASDGVYHAPTLARGGSTAERLVSSETASSVMALLETVVADESGTGTEARVDGVHVAGKTGTAQWTAPDGRERTYASFIGVADLPSRRIVALIGIEATPRDNLYGGNSAAPAFARLVKQIIRAK